MAFALCADQKLPLLEIFLFISSLMEKYGGISCSTFLCVVQVQARTTRHQHQLTALPLWRHSSKEISLRLSFCLGAKLLVYQFDCRLYTSTNMSNRDKKNTHTYNYSQDTNLAMRLLFCHYFTFHIILCLTTKPCHYLLAIKLWYFSFHSITGPPTQIRPNKTHPV